ncbi:hypothetical protein ACHAPT_005458 [Fusarium lateritium]
MTSIPDEIWRDIFSYFECDLPLEKWWMYGAQLDHTPLKTLMSICRVGRRFYRVVRPLIYRKVLIDAFDEAEGRYDQLLRTLVSNPQLGRGIRTITLGDGYQVREYDFEDAMKSTWLSLDAPMAFKKQLGQEIEQDRTIALAPLILALTHQVRLVDCTYSSQSQCTPWILSGRPDLDIAIRRSPFDAELAQDDVQALEAYRVEQGDSYANYRLPNLEEVRIRTGDCTDDNTPINTLEPVLLHSNLKTLRLLGISWLGHLLNDLKFPNEPCNLEYLDLKECLFDYLSLENILTRCKKLKWLSMETADCRRHNQSHDDGEWEIDLGKFGNVLRRLGQNLEYFSLHTIEFETDGWCEGRLGSLRNLQALHHLRVILNNFTGRVRDPWETDREPEIPLAEALPPMIETLHLHWDDMYYDHNSYKRYCDNINGAVVKLLEAGGFPNLRKVSIERYGGKREAEFDKSVDGWHVEVTQEHLWERYASTGCMRTMIYLTRKDEL